MTIYYYAYFIIMNNRATLYLRSSKDRSDVSIDAQRRDLQALAEKLNLIIVSEFSDAVESGKDNNRPGFQALFTEMCSSKRPWSKILVLDTARLSRRRVNAIVFEEIEAKRRNVSIIYKSLPDSDPITDMLLKSILQAMDEWHSLTSKQKGLAGMAENVKQGFRAGGRAPFGYDLEKFNTGAIRDGEPVTKTKLKPNADAKAIAEYLTDKASGVSRANSKKKTGITIPDTTLISIEWNALTYAGHTVWNVHNERTEDGYATGAKRRPRNEWVIQKNTHEALITDNQAETILSKLIDKNTRRSTPATYLLTGLLQTQDGQPWHGDGTGTYYRLGKGKKVRCDALDALVLRKIRDDIASPEFISRVTKAVKASLKPEMQASTEKELRSEFQRINKKIDSLAAMLADTSAPAAILRQIEKYEIERGSVLSKIENIEAQAAQAKVINLLTERDVRSAIEHNIDAIETLDRENLKEMLSKLIDSVILNPLDLTCSLNYRINLKRGDNMASPRGFDAIPSIILSSIVRTA